ncbi:unnamed protein product [Rotaria sp. Silwood2]|nr:unnamed protein product [Rotaria sp. Silwood2]CAF4360165.1 unnamed protein product [Rotaria sp. Silwood2]
MLVAFYVTYFVFASFCFDGTQEEPIQYVDGYRSSCKFYQAGTFNLILSAPHGGSIMPTDVPDRTQGGCRRPGSYCTWRYDDPCLDGVPCIATTVQDSLVDQLTENIAAELNTTFNKKPYIVIGKWSRKKVDFNREINEATFNHPEAISAYQSYHTNLQYAIDQVKQLYGNGLLIDIHGHGEGNFTMVGCLLYSSLLNRDDLQSTLDTLTSIEQICSLSNRTECIRGQTSFGTVFERNELGIAYPSRHINDETV